MDRKNDQTSDYCLFIYIVASCGMNGSICVTLWPIQKNCCLSNFVFCEFIAQLLVFNCFLRKEGRKRIKIFVTVNCSRAIFKIMRLFLVFCCVPFNDSFGYLKLFIFLDSARMDENVFLALWELSWVLSHTVCPNSIWHQS